MTILGTISVDLSIVCTIIGGLLFTGQNIGNYHVAASDETQSPTTEPATTSVSSQEGRVDGGEDVGIHPIPEDFLSPMSAYPNLLNITEEDRRTFHPVVKFPMIWSDENDDNSRSSRRRRRIPNYAILDLQAATAQVELATEQERQKRRNNRRQLLPWKKTKEWVEGYHVGRYDENRINLYASELFDDTSNQIDGFAGLRTIHIGMDLDGPLYTKVFSFCEGIIHKVGYNEPLGDYGNVIVIEHHLPKTENDEAVRKLYALYGHLDDKSIKGKKVGQRVKKGQLLGRMGDIHENGGWRISHVHFQLSVSPPETHDMPGTVSLEDRSRALLEYPDPRLVLGELY